MTRVFKYLKKYLNIQNIKMHILFIPVSLAINTCILESDNMSPFVSQLVITLNVECNDMINIIPH